MAAGRSAERLGVRFGSDLRRGELSGFPADGVIVLHLPLSTLREMPVAFPTGVSALFGICLLVYRRRRRA